MNRERGISGFNSYPEDLGFDPLAFLTDRLKSRSQVRWLDLCCGSGRALIEGAKSLSEAGHLTRIWLDGVDLVPMFYPVPPFLTQVRLITASISDWEPEDRYDLITCVHGLHYIGDKVGLVCRSVSWLSNDGLFAANLDLNNLRFDDEKPAGRTTVSALRDAGFEYDARRRLLTRTGRAAPSIPFTYLGADDRAGPNYTGQSAVNSVYSRQPYYHPRFDPCTAFAGIMSVGIIEPSCEGGEWASGSHW